MVVQQHRNIHKGSIYIFWYCLFFKLPEKEPNSINCLGALSLCVWAEPHSQPLHYFIYITAHSPTLLLLHLHNRHFTYITCTSPTSQALHLRRRHFTYVTDTSSLSSARSPTFPSLHLHHNSSILPLLYLCHISFSNPSVASCRSQFILQPFFRFSYVTSSSLNSPGEPPMQVNKNCII